MKTLNDKLSILASMWKPTAKQLIQKSGSFIRPKDDQTAWTDGYFAETRAYDLEQIKAEAELINAKGKLMLYVAEENAGPELKMVIPTCDSEPLEDIIFEFIGPDAVTLKSKNYTKHINGNYIGYFLRKYPYAKIELTPDYKPIKIFDVEELVGVIMPVRIPE